MRVSPVLALPTFSYTGWNGITRLNLEAEKETVDLAFPEEN